MLGDDITVEGIEAYLLPFVVDEDTNNRSGVTLARPGEPDTMIEFLNVGRAVDVHGDGFAASDSDEVSHGDVRRQMGE
jgi:hypothetical protein